MRNVYACLGESRRDAVRRSEYLTLTDDRGPWRCARSQHLRDARIGKWSKFARHHKSWGRALRWIKEFAGFARAMCTANRVVYDAVKMRADNHLCCLFLTEVAEQMKGISRVSAARRALSAQRLREGSPTLNADHNISLLIDGVRRSQPKTTHQVESLDVNDVVTIASALSRSLRWQDRQLGVLIATGFLTIMRYAELQRVRRDGVRLVFKSGREVTMSALKFLPPANLLSGILIHLSWRKSAQEVDAWIPLSCQVTIRRLLQHESTLRQLGCPSHRLFPSVTRTRGRPPHPSHFFGSTQFRDGLRKALRDFCGMSLEESKVYGGHSLRVGGSNFMRRLKIDRDVHRSLGGWSSLKSSGDYMQLTPTEQFTITRKLAVKKERECAFERPFQARASLARVRQLVLGG